MKRPQFRLVVGVVEAQHLLPVRNLLEPLHPVVAHALRRRILRGKLRKLFLEHRQFPFQGIVAEVGNLRIGLPVVALVVPRHLRAEVDDLCLGVGRGHAGSIGDEPGAIFNPHVSLTGRPRAAAPAALGLLSGGALR